MALDKLKYTYQDPARVSQLTVDNVLNVNTTNATTVNSKAQIISPDSTNVGLTLRSPESTISDLQQFRNSSNTITSGVNAAGQMYIGGTSVALQSSNTANLLPSVIANGITVTYHANAGFTGNNPFFAGATILISGFTGVTGYNGTFIIQSVGGVSGAYNFTVANTTTGVPGGSPVAIQSPNLSVIAQNPWNTPIVVRGANSQTSDLQVWQNVNGTVLSRMNASGSLTLVALHPARIQDSALTGAQIVPVSNTPNLLNSSGMSIRALGANQQALTVRSSLSAYTITAATANGTTITYTTTGDTQFIYVGMGVTITGVASTGNVSATAGTGFNLTGATIASVTGQQFTITNSLVDTYTSGGTATATTTADIQQWQTSSSTVLARITGTGGATFAGNSWLQGGLLVQGNYGGATTMAITNNQNIIGLTITANSTQSANLQEWRNNGGGVLAAVLTSGFILTAGLTDVAGNGAFLSTAPGNSISVNTRTSTIVGFIVKGVASQSANLQQWQNSAGTVLSAIDIEGNFTKGDGDQLVLSGQIF